MHPFFPIAFATATNNLPINSRKALPSSVCRRKHKFFPPLVVASSVAPMHVHTPLVESAPLSALAKRRVLLKLDNQQPSGSFKIRGHGNLCRSAAKSGVRHFISSSGGNAGAAVALAGQKLGVPVTIVVPSSTPAFMISRLRSANATVIVHGSVWDESDRHARELWSSEPQGKAIHISPFDHPLLWAGISSLVDEVHSDIPNEKPSAIVVSVGGGGLFLGTAEGLSRVGWGDVRIVAAETEGADSFAAMLRAGGRVVRLPEISSIAKSLGALAVSERCAEWVRGGRKILGVTVSDREAVEACSMLAVHHRILVEPACGAAIAAVVKHSDLMSADDDGPIVVVVCGGNMASPALLDMWIKDTGAKEAVLE